MIGGLYIAYKRPKCVDFVLKNYRENYPDTDIVLVSDGGDDYSEVAKKYNCKYFYEENLTCFHGKQDALKMNYPIWNNEPEKKKESLKKSMKRIANKLSLIKENYFMLLEDDVYVIRSTDVKDLSFSINGCNPYSSLPKEVSSYLFNRDNLIYGGCGGCIFNKNFFKDVLSSHKTDDDIEFYCDLTKNYVEDGNQTWWGLDCILSYLCYYNKGTIGQYPGFCETWHNNANQRLQLNTVEVLHKFKNLY